MSAVVLTQGGELDIASIPRLMQRLEPYRQPGREIVLDLRGVEFMDCYSLGHLLGAHADSATEGWTMRLLVETAPVLRLLELTGAGRLLPLDMPAAA
jgi:anti-sigma B factor antagonist